MTIVVNETTEAPVTDFANRMSYSGYLHLERLLDAQQPLSESPDELLFIIQHQTSELWMKLIVHEVSCAINCVGQNQLGPACKMLMRVARIFEQLNGAWEVLRTMTPTEFLRFRNALGQSSGFQSWQYRAIEFLAGNRNAAMLNPHAHDVAVTARLRSILEAPSLYDEAIRLLARNGFDTGEDARRNEWSRPREANNAVLTAWTSVYETPESYWPLYQLAESLVDFEERFRLWRFNHVSTVERVIGMKRGTGGTSGVSYLRKSLEVQLFPELWAVRTSLGTGPVPGHTTAYQ